ncbi:transcription factor TT2 [Corchorus olitorius]|uniref:Transcription factor TT2 n=1 Tax=Corchorus olitorius TaxID=93759 RepID=A0A1R3H727_9ROSI|nr:transcription factor TT2 [Corchorus olitorius]
MTKLPDETKSSENVHDKEDIIDPSNFMTDLVLDENFLSEFLNSEFSQQQLHGDHHHSYSNYTEITSSPNSDQSLFFSTDMMQDYHADFTSMASLMDSEFDWAN